MNESKFLKYRYVLWFAFLFVIALVVVTDPDIGGFFELKFGAYTIVMFLNIGMVLLMAGLLHVAYRGNYDYVDDYKITKLIIESKDVKAIATMKQSNAIYAVAIAISFLAGAVVLS